MREVYGMITTLRGLRERECIKLVTLSLPSSTKDHENFEKVPSNIFQVQGCEDSNLIVETGLLNWIINWIMKNPHSAYFHRVLFQNYGNSISIRISQGNLGFPIISEKLSLPP